jgi:DNA adenine methylase
VQIAAQRTKSALYSGAPLANPGKGSPFLKWAGGKTELLRELESRVPKSYGTYWEAFIGGGALFFRLAPMSGVISDANEELINCYLAVRNNLDELISRLKKFPVNKEHFLKLRKIQPWELDDVGRAARLIYLNKTCFNGLYRVNQRGEFNVPFGDYKNPRVFDPEILEADSKALKKAEVICRDFRHLLYKAQPGDFIYFDPPYHPLSETSSFTSYSEAPFEEREQRALAQVFKALSERDCKVMLSNSDTPKIRSLYKTFNIDEVQVSRAINCKGDGRGKITELIIRNY